MAKIPPSKGKPGFAGKIKGSENKRPPPHKGRPTPGPGGLGPSQGGLGPPGPPPDLLNALGAGGGMMGEGGPGGMPVGGPPMRKKRGGAP
jgi:hypothetical protein